MAPPRIPLDEFALAVICPLEIEALAMIRQLDEDKDYGLLFSEDCSFTLGNIGEHNVVITSLLTGRGGQGNSPAVVAAQQTKAKFQNIRYILSVGIAGGVPSVKNDIRLGDIVVSFPTGRYGGVVQYGYGKEEERLQMNSVPQQLLAYLDFIKLRHSRYTKRVPKYVEYLDAQVARSLLERPNGDSDLLFPATYVHHGLDCTNCDEKQAQIREARSHPQVHYGLIVSGNCVMENGQQRDQCNQDHDGIVFSYDMEAASLMSFTPCLVIRGISDYSDSHKPPGKMWHAFAAIAAASFARELIEEVPTEKVSVATVRTPSEGQQHGSHFSGVNTMESGNIIQIGTIRGNMHFGGISSPEGRNSKSSEPHWNVPFGRNKEFIGRESELESLMARLDLENADDCQRVAIAGLGGIGKTQIALEVAFQIKKRFPDFSVFWVPAINAASFESAYREIGQRLEIPGMNNKADIKSLVKEFLSQECVGRWLMIVDNADDLEMLFKAGEDIDGSGSALVDFLPFSRSGSIIFTTRNFEAAIKQAGTNIIKVEEMNETGSHELLEKNLVEKRLMEDKESVLKLLELLTYLPLAVKQAAAFINAKRVSISTYVKIYESSNDNLIELLSKNFEDQGRYKDIKNPIALTWSISFKQIKRSDQLAAEYLYIMSCVSHQGIPHSILPPAPDLQQLEAIGTLKAYAFITERIGQNSYDIHRLVQLVVRNSLKIEEKLDFWSSRTLERVAEIFPFCKHGKQFECALLLPHTQYILEFQRLSRYSGKSSSELLFNVGQYFSEIGKYNEAETMYRRALELRKETLSLKHLSTLHTMNNLAEVFHYQGKYQEAEIMHQQTLESREEVLGLEHPDTLFSMNNLANVLHSLGRYKDAETMHRQNLKLMEKVLGSEHLSTLTSMNNIANVLGDQGQHKEAELIQRHTSKLMEKVIGLKHPVTLSNMNNLAEMLNLQGKYQEAEIIHQQTLELREEVLGCEHPDISESMNNLALVLYNQGKYDESETMLRQTLELMEKVLGRKHPSTLSSINNLALSLCHQGKQEGETMHRRTLKLKEEVLGPEHPSTLGSMNNLAIALDHQGKHEESETMHRRTLDLMEKVLGTKHPSTLESMDSLASALNNQGKYNEAETMHRQTLELMEKVLGPENPSTLASMNNLAITLDYQGKHEEAETMHRRALMLMEKVLGSEHPLTLESIDRQWMYKVAKTMHQSIFRNSTAKDGEDIEKEDQTACPTIHLELQQESISLPLAPPAPNPRPAYLILSRRRVPPRKPLKPTHLKGADRMN